MSIEQIRDFAQLTSSELEWVQYGTSGILNLEETTAPSHESGIGKLYVKSSDSRLYFKDDSGNEYDLLSGSDGDTKEPTGFLQTIDNLKPASSEISFVNGTRTFTIDVAATFSEFSFYIQGTKFTKTTAQTVQISDSEGLHYIYFDTDGVLKETLSEAEFDITILPYKALVSVIYWDKTNQQAIYFAEERHFNSMPGSTHAHIHFIQGSKFISGSALANFAIDQDGSLDSHAQFSIDSGEMRDEDIRNLAPGISSTTGLPVFYKLGSSGFWRRGINSGFSFLNTGTGRAAWNENVGGTWQLTEVTNNKFFLIHVFHINDINVNNGYIAVMGQAQYDTISAARAGANTEINNLNFAGLPFVEWVPIGSIIGQTSDSYTNSVKTRIRTNDLGGNYVDWRTSGISPATVNINSHLLLPDLNGGDGVGNHTNAFNLLGRSGGQIAIGGTATTEKLRLQDNSVDGNYIEIGSGVVDFNNLNLSNIGSISGFTSTDNILIDDTKYIQFGSTSLWLKSDASNFGAGVLVMDSTSPSAYKEIASTGGFRLYANTGATGGGNWEPLIYLNTDGTAEFVNTTQGSVGSKYLKIDFTDGLHLDTGGNDAILKADNIASSDKTFQFPNASGTFITTGNLTDIVTLGTVTTGNVDAIISAASTTLAGKVELATATETTNGTDNTRAVTPDGLAGSNYGKRVVELILIEGATDVAVGDKQGNLSFRVPVEMNGWNLVGIAAHVETAGTTGNLDIQIHNITQAADMLSTKMRIETGETDTSTSAQPGVIDTANDDVATADKIRIDVDSVQTTAPKGLTITLVFQLP
jgi:hypothetical protein